MIREICSLKSSCKKELIPHPSGKLFVACCWILTIKIGPNGKVDRLKEYLVAKDCKGYNDMRK